MRSFRPNWTEVGPYQLGEALLPEGVAAQSVVGEPVQAAPGAYGRQDRGGVRLTLVKPLNQRVRTLPVPAAAKAAKAHLIGQYGHVWVQSVRKQLLRGKIRPARYLGVEKGGEQQLGLFGV